MRKLFEKFQPSSLEEWTNQIVKELKGKELESLDFNDPIEEIDFRAFYHADNSPVSALNPGDFPATRGSKTTNNDWNNGALIDVKEEGTANKRALELLSSGADLLYFVQKTDKIDWTKVLEGVELQYIKAQFQVDTPADLVHILEIASEAKNHIAFCFNALHSEKIVEISPFVRASQIPTFLVNGFGVQQSGATSWQEIVFCLSAGHEALLQLMNHGYSCDEAAVMVHFHVGIGANYFNEIAKFRALRMLWSKIIDAYKPEHDCSYNCQMTAIVGHTNKSLKDPYTNLLRQTTEVMSATNGADSIIVLPYDLYSSAGTSEIAQRMALNISLILKEESYLNHVIDPTAGSYSVEQLTDKIGRKAWELFQQMDGSGGIREEKTQAAFIEAISLKREMREEAITSGKQTLIGINKFPDPNAKDAEWIVPPSYLGMQPFVAEFIVKTDLV